MISEQKIDINKPLVLTFDNKPENDETQYFIKTLKRHNWEYKIVGVGQEWHGVKTKIKGYLEPLKTLDKNMIVVLSDARDVICMRNSQHFINAFRSYNAPIVVSMELFAEGLMEYTPNYNYSQCVDITPYNTYWKRTSMLRKYVNSGLIVGYAKDLVDLFSWIDENNFDNDQPGVGAYMNKFPEKIVADYDGNFLHSTGYGVNGGIQYIDFQAIDSPNLAEINGTSSFFLHIPGTSKIKGQRRIYEQVKTLLESGLFDREIYFDYIPFHPPTNFKTKINR